MKQFARQILVAGTLYLGCLAAINSAQAQITSDGTLPSRVSQDGNVFQITGGAQAGNNLFHSFQQFSIPTGNTAFFNNASNIVNIISRVTGGSISTIDGLIRANGSANLILINPSGINFGLNAQLNIGGSFLGSTASSLVFEDGTVFSATNPQASPLLTVSVPVGLQFGPNPGAIQVEGTGHNLSLEAPIFSPFTRGSVTGLKVQPGQTLALVGGDLVLEGGTLTAEGGRIELGSAAEGLVSLSSTLQGWTLGYEGVSAFKDIELRSRSLADASGVGSGSIQVQGRRISVRDGSTVLIQNQGFQSAGNLSVNASEFLEVRGTTPDGSIASTLFTETVGGGKGGDIAISSPRLVVQEGGGISAATFTAAAGGHITVDASESVQLIGFSPVNPSRFSNITAATFGAGRAGDIIVSTGGLTALNGGNLGSVTGGIFGTGSGGDITVNATESVELMGVTPILLAPSQVTAGTGGTGDAGNVTINTQRLVVRDGGRVDASTTATGDAGTVTINASESVEVSGTVPGSRNPSLVISSANILDPALQQLLRLPPVPSGNSGDVMINTGQLSITDGAQVTTSNDGLGNAGNVTISARSILLDNEGGITAETGGTIPDIFLNQGSTTGEVGGPPPAGQIPSVFFPQTEGNGKGGDIAISTQQLVVRGGAGISTATFTDTTGGNVTVDASESVQVIGFSPANPSSLSFISTSTFGSGESGDVTISTGRLAILDGGRVGAGTFFATGSGGDLTVNATESVEVIGAEPSQLAGSLLGPSSLSAGDAGNLSVNTSRLVVRDGGRIDSSAAGTGDAGSVTINASESVEVSGTVPGTLNPTLVSAGANIEDEIVQQIFGLPPVPSGNSGDVTINTGQLRVTDGAQVTARNEGSGNGGNVAIATQSLSVTNGAEVSVLAAGEGDAGTLGVNANSIFLDNQGSISAATAAGGGGDINLQVNSLLMRRNSQIAATAGGASDGGNITLTGLNPADFVVLLEGSEISANAFQGRGGNIQIDTRGLFICGDCQITATSELGVEGLVTINRLQPNTELQVINVPQELAESEEVVALACSTTEGQDRSEFIITGRGGLPPRPTESLSSENLVSFDSSPSTPKNPSVSAPPAEETDASELPAPARGWYVNPEGVVILAAQAPSALPYSSGLTTPKCHGN
jgi:filamentous hemagglutinin family protein